VRWRCVTSTREASKIEIPLGFFHSSQAGFLCVFDPGLLPGFFLPAVQAQNHLSKKRRPYIFLFAGVLNYSATVIYHSLDAEKDP